MFNWCFGREIQPPEIKLTQDFFCEISLPVCACVKMKIDLCLHEFPMKSNFRIDKLDFLWKIVWSWKVTRHRYVKNNIQMSWFAERERKNSGTLKEHRNVRRTWKNKRGTFVCVDDTNLIQLKSFWKIMFKVEFAHTVRAAAMMETTKTTI